MSDKKLKGIDGGKKSNRVKGNTWWPGDNMSLSGLDNDAELEVETKKLAKRMYDVMGVDIGTARRIIEKNYDYYAIGSVVDFWRDSNLPKIGDDPGIDEQLGVVVSLLECGSIPVIRLHRRLEVIAFLRDNLL